MNGTYIVEKEFDYTDYANQMIHIDKGVLLRYETYTRPDMLGMNNSLAIHIINIEGNEIIIRGPFIYMPDYVRDITQEDIIKAKKQKAYCDNILNEISEPTKPKHLQVLQFNNLNSMNKTLNKYDEKDIVSITPIKVTTNTGIGHAPEDTIIYCVTVRE